MSLFGDKKKRDDEELFKAALRDMVAAGASKAKMEYISFTTDDLEHFEPLELRVGDKVKWKTSAFKYASIPKAEQVCVVTKVAGMGGIGMPTVAYEPGQPTHVNDFCLAFITAEGVLEYPYDSRYFEKVE